MSREEGTSWVSSVCILSCAADVAATRSVEGGSRARGPRSVTVAKAHKSHEPTQAGKKREKVVKGEDKMESCSVCVRWLVIDRASAADAGFAACSTPQPSTTPARSFNPCSVCVSLDLAFWALGWILGSFIPPLTVRYAEESPKSSKKLSLG
jgi:hypothetical protein